MATLYQRLLPKYQDKLKSYKDEYPSSIEGVEKALKATSYYGDLTISQLASLHSFCDIDIIHVSCFDFRFGDHLLITTEKLELATQTQD